MILCHVTYCKMGVITRVQLLGGTTPLKFGRAKNVQKTFKNRCDLRQLSSLTANISGMNKDIDKR